MGELKWANVMNDANVTLYYDELAEAITSENIQYQDIWNLNEKGLTMDSGVLHQCIAMGVDQLELQIPGDECRKMVTALECISAAGLYLLPLIIHEGAEKDDEWIRNNPCGAE